MSMLATPRGPGNGRGGSPPPAKSNSLSDFFSRADGGLIALTVSALTIVAGMNKLGDLDKIINIKFMIGGLCTALFFAILCVYFTLFGMRATANAASAAGLPIRFDDQLPVTIDPERPRRWLAQFIGGLLIFIVPAILVLMTTTAMLGDDLPGASAVQDTKVPARFSSLKAKVDNDCPATPAASKTQPSPKSALASDALLAPEKCEKAKSNLQSAIDQPARQRALIANLVISSVIVLYILAPPVAWVMAVDDRALPGKAHASGQLKRQVSWVQTLRLMAAFSSLAAFMVGVGLALVNTSAAYVASGLSDPGQPIPPGAAAPRSGDITLTQIAQQLATNGVSVAPTPINIQLSTPTPSVQLNVPSNLTLTMQDASATSGSSHRTVSVEGQVTLKPAANLSLPVVMPPAPAQPIIVQSLQGAKGDKGDRGDPAPAATIVPVWHCGAFGYWCKWVYPPAPVQIAQSHR